VYRVRQFARATGAWIHGEDVEETLLSRYLSEQAVDLFRAMPRYDQQHALSVFCTLQQRGYDQPDLLTAALLHDVGKSLPRGGGPRLGHRVATVLMRAFWPGLLDRLGRDEREDWRRPFFVQQHHAAISAQLALQVGCSPVTVELIRHHEDESEPTNDPLLSALQAADSMN
jgi:hypothetical protein